MQHFSLILFIKNVYLWNLFNSLNQHEPIFGNDNTAGTSSVSIQCQKRCHFRIKHVPLWNWELHWCAESKNPPLKLDQTWGINRVSFFSTPMFPFLFLQKSKISGLPLLAELVPILPRHRTLGFTGVALTQTRTLAFSKQHIYRPHQNYRGGQGCSRPAACFGTDTRHTSENIDFYKLFDFRLVHLHAAAPST